MEIRVYSSGADLLDIIICAVYLENWNLKSIDQGFDRRVLEVNRQAATQAGAHMPFAEIFEVRYFG